MSTGTILLVDDEAKILAALASALRTEGHEVVATGSAREAQRLLSQRVFDVLVVDNLMPELTGLDLIRELGPNTIIVAGSPPGSESGRTSISCTPPPLATRRGWTALAATSSSSLASARRAAAVPASGTSTRWT